MIKINLRGSYGGIESYRRVKKYNKRNKYNKNKRIFRRVIFIVSLSALVAIIGIKSQFSKEGMKLSDEIVTYYINETDSVSDEKLQLSWKEVAAIDLELNNGEENLNNSDGVKKIAEMFFEYDEEEKVSEIKSFNEVLNEVGLKSEEKENAYKYLVKIEKNYLNRNLINEKNKMKFISDIEEDAKNNYEEYGILPSITMAQAILESAWGESTLSSEHNNLFGIKADDRWNGKKVNMETKENYDDVIEDYFRVYASYESSVEDHGKFLSENSRYRNNGIFDKKTYKGQAQALEDAGYATAKNENGELIYADSLINVIQKNNLMLYDTEVQR